MMEAEAPEPPQPADDGAPNSGDVHLDELLEVEASTSLTGDGLTDAEADALLAVRRSTVVVLAGGVRSGKTTLLTSVYEQLNQQPFGSYDFAGSSTLFGFEKRGHGWREHAGMQVAMTERTGLNQPPWLHLLLREDPPAPFHQLLLADLSGEHFERLVSGDRAPDSLPMLSRADHVAVVLNGRKLSDPKERLTERSRAEQLLQILTAAGVLASACTLSVIVTKLDRYLADGRDDDLDAVIHRLGTTAKLEHPLPLFRTAAQPQVADYPMGHGVDALMAHWLTGRQHKISPDQPVVPAPTSAFERFGLTVEP